MAVVPEYLRVPFMQRAIQLCNLTNLTATAENLNYLDIIITHESGWDCRAVNNTDSNAKAGHPSRGLMQVIPTTFAAYQLPGLDEIENPIDNMVAGIRYAVSRYKALEEVPGVVAVLAGNPYRGY